jgi:hypothetical protein
MLHLLPIVVVVRQKQVEFYRVEPVEESRTPLLSPFGKEAIRTVGNSTRPFVAEETATPSLMEVIFTSSSNQDDGCFEIFILKRCW